MIDTVALKSKILELALTGQILNSGKDANQLFDSIVASVYKTDKRKVSDKNYDLSDLSFQIPYNWKWVWLGDIFQHNTGKALNSSNTDGISLEYITTSNLYWDKFELKDLKTMFFKESEIEKYTIKKGDLLVCEGGDIGRTAIWSENYEMRIQNHIHRLRPYVDEISVRFYYYVMMYYKNNGFINGRGIGLQGLSSKRLHVILVPLPDSETQYLIAEKIDELFKVIDTIEKLQLQFASNLEVLQSKIIDAGIQGKLTEQLLEDGTAQDLYISIQEEKSKLIKEKKIKKEKPIDDITEDEIPFEISENWKWVRMSEILDVRDGTHDSPQYYAVGIPMITSKNLVSGVLEFENVKYVSEEDAKKINERSAVQDGDILFAMIGTIGNPVLVKKDREFVVKNVALFKKYGNTKLSMEYIYWYLMREQNEFKKIVSGGLQPFISLKQFREHVMPLPPYEEQKRIVNRLETLFESM